MTSRPQHSVVVIGTGSFATELCRALAGELVTPATVHVMGRTLESGAAVCAAVHEAATARGTAGARPAASTGPVEFRPVAAGLAPRADLRSALASLRPDLVVVCASYQSPREIWRGDSEWSRLVGRAGFAVTLPLQAALADRVAAACAEFDATIVVNACFPDAVNAILRARGRSVLCGVGNVATLADELQRTLPISDPARLKLLAHHAHLHEPEDPTLEARCWFDDLPHPDVSALLAPVRAMPRARLNDHGAAAAAQVVHALVEGTRYVGHLPGPVGLPGGYPVEIAGGSVTLRLPPGVSAAAALAWNHRVSALDGGSVDVHGTFHLAGGAVEALAPYWPQPPESFSAETLTDTCDQMLRLRERLRQQVPA